MKMSDDERIQLIKLWHQQEMPLNDIVHLLGNRGHETSRRQLTRILSHHDLRRRQYCSEATLVTFIHDTLQGSGNLHGYRWMYERCIANGIRCRKEDVRQILAALDAHGVQQRKAHRLHRRQYAAAGPNCIWHVDSYDKLKPYGLCINGGIDGFSRSVIWLHTYSTNSDPRIVGGYYMDAVQNLHGCPTIVRTDPGTENVTIRDLHRFLLRDLDPGGSFVYKTGCSTANQRIEAFWCQLRKECVEYWLTAFHELQNAGQYDGEFIDKNIAQFCFMGVLQVTDVNT